MRNFRHSALGLIAAAASLAVASDVTVLKTDTFEPFVKEHDLVLAEFYAPWCGHCKALAPEYEEAATTLKEKNIQLAKVDCTEEADLCQTYGVEGYPTLKIFRGKENISAYSGQRKAPAIISYMTKQALPAVSVLDKNSLPDFTTADHVVLVGFFDAKDKASNETFTKAAENLRDSFLFGATNDADLAKAEGVKQPGIILYKDFDEGKSVFEEKFTEDAIATFSKQSSIPLIGEVGPETYAGYMAAQLPLAYVFAEEKEEREKLTQELKPIAQKHKGKINIATIDAKAFGQHGSNLNLDVTKWPAFAIQETVKNEKYPLDQTKPVNAETVGQFVDDFVAGKLEPSIKSEPIPEKQDGPVTVVVAHNYKDIVMDDKKDVLLEFYAPWCGHCKSLAPKYEELAQLFAPHSDKAIIAKVDATANDVPDEIQGFPTIKLFAAGKKDSPIEYDGARTSEDLAVFMRDKGSNKVDVVAAEPEDDVASESASAKVAGEETMQHQAPAATEKVKEAADKVAEGAQKVMDAATGEGEDEHDEL